MNTLHVINEVGQFTGKMEFAHDANISCFCLLCTSKIDDCSFQGGHNYSTMLVSAFETFSGKMTIKMFVNHVMITTSWLHGFYSTKS